MSSQSLISFCIVRPGKSSMLLIRLSLTHNDSLTVKLKKILLKESIGLEIVIPVMPINTSKLSGGTLSN